MSANVSINESVSVVDSFVLYVEYKIAVSILCGLLLTINILAIYVLRQTSRIPPLNKFLASALLLFHVVSNGAIIIGKITLSVNVSTSMLCFSVVVVFTTANAPTVALMSVERLWALSSMRLYFKYHNTNVIKLIPILLWTLYGVSVFVFRTVLCPISTMAPPLVCIQLFRRGAPAMIAIWIGISLTCYIKIYKIIRRTFQKRPVGWQRPGRFFADVVGGYSTGVVFAFLVTTAMNLILLFITGWIHNGPDVEKVVLLIDIVEMFNAIMDPFLYVLWFKECRFVVMKKLMFFLPGTESTVELMRIEVYDIVTASKLRTTV